MTLEQLDDGRLRLRDSPGSLIHWVGLALAAIGLAAIFFSKSLVAGLVTAFAVAGLWLALRYSDVATEASFNRRDGSFRVRHKSLGKAQHEWRGRIEEIEDVVVEASTRSRDRRGPNGAEALALRPSLVIAGRPLPLTFGRYAPAEEAREVALRLRSYLGLSRRGLLEDSIRIAARDPLRTQPALRLARLGKGLSANEAAEYVERVKREHGEWDLA